MANPKGTVLRFRLKQNHGGANSDDNENNNLGRIRLSVTTAPDAAADPLPQSVREILSIPREQRSPAQVQRDLQLLAHHGCRNGRRRMRPSPHFGSEHPEGSLQLVLAEREDDPRETHILKRGDFLQPDRAVEPGTPAFLHPLPAGAPPNRLTFARWLVDRRSPTTARSIVNRDLAGVLRHRHRGHGGESRHAGEPPSNQELLDWLAVEFMDRGWSLKKLHRLIVTSATYRQSSNVTPELLARDPDNRLLARGPRFRVDAETGARHRAGGQRPAQSRSRRPQRVSARARVPLPAAGQLRAEDLEDGRRRGALPPRALHLPLPLRALSDAAGLRCAERRNVLRAPGALQHAAAGAHHAE